MCLYPKKYINKKYTVTEKNGGNVPEMPKTGTDENGYPIYDERVGSIEIPCGFCIECRKKKANGWRVRIHEEIKTCSYPYFVTFTFAPEMLDRICRKTGITNDNDICAYALRHCLERFRKKYKKSLRHWMVVELGHEGTERVHMHGILFSHIPLEFKPSDDKNYQFWEYWSYGLIYVGQYVNSRTANYIVKYMCKIDEKHPEFVGKVLCSPGIGRNFAESFLASSYKYKPRQSKIHYVAENGQKMPLPSYYKNKLYNDDDREKIWREFMDEEKTSIMGIEHSNNISNRTFGKILNKAREVNKALGFGDSNIRKKDFHVTMEMRKTNQEKVINRLQTKIDLKKKLLKIAK